MECQISGNDIKTREKMKEYKYTIEGKEYKVEIGTIEENIAEVTVNGETFKVEMEPEPEPEKKKVVVSAAAAPANDEQPVAAGSRMIYRKRKMGFVLIHIAYSS